MLFLGVLIIAIFGLVPSQGGLRLVARWEPQRSSSGSRRFVVKHALRDPTLEPLARRWLWLRALEGSGSDSAVHRWHAATRRSDMRWHGSSWCRRRIHHAGAFNAWVLLVEIQR